MYTIPLQLHEQGGTDYSFTDMDTFLETRESRDYLFNEQEVQDEIESYIFDAIVWVAENNKRPKDDKLSWDECPYPLDFVQELMEWTDFIYNSDDDILDDYDLYKGWEALTKIYYNPKNKKYYGVPYTRSGYGDNDWYIADFCEAVAKERIEKYYALLDGED